MYKSFVTTLLLSFCVHAIAQPGPKVMELARNETARQYAEQIDVNDLRRHLEVLASDEYEGRETGTRGQKKAAQYLADYYQSLGVAPCVNGSFFQTYPLKREGVMESYLEINTTRIKFLDGFYFFPYQKVGETISLNNLVFAGYGIADPVYNDYEGVDIRDKTVLIFPGEPVNKKGISWITGTSQMSDWGSNWGRKFEAARSRGAAAVVLLDPDYQMTVSRIKHWLMNPQMRLDYPDGFREQGSNTEEDGPELPFLLISAPTADALLKEAKAGSVDSQRKKLNKKFKPVTKAIPIRGAFHIKRQSEKLQAENVLCYIEGSDPALKHELVVISAHYDHIGISHDGQINNGADDDGSGTVSALEIAQAFMAAKKDGNGPRRSILVLHVSGEEKGLLGSEWYSEYPVFDMKNTVCSLNIDMVGRVDKEHESTGPNYVYLIGSDKLSTELHEISEACNSAYTQLKLDYTYNDPEDPNRFYYRSDHYNFAKRGVPVIFYFSGVHEDYHKPGDDVEKIIFDKMQNIARLVFYTAWSVANRDERLKVDVENSFKN